MTAGYEPNRDLSYPDRWHDAVARDASLDVYVPNGPTHISPGSGIVGTTLPDGTVSVHYEGWVHSARLVITEARKVNDDLVRDMTGVLTSFCARLYGRRSAARRARQALICAGQGPL